LFKKKIKHKQVMLTDEEQRKVREFKDATGVEDDDAATQILRQNSWNLGVSF